jgi:hypothetical protein
MSVISAVSNPANGFFFEDVTALVREREPPESVYFFK